MRASFWLLAIVLAIAPSASAQDRPPRGTTIATGEPSAYRFYAAPGPGNFLMVDDTTIGREWEPSVGLLFDYAHRPFALDDVEYYTYSGDLRGSELDVVEGMATLQITGAVSFADLVQIGVNVPVILYTFGDGHRWDESTEPGMPVPNSFPGGGGATLGDPRLHGKIRFFDQDLGGDAHLSVAGVAWITFPTARAILPRRYAGEPGVAGGGHLVLSFRWQSLRIAIDAGAAIREEAQLVLSRRTSEFTWGGGVAYDFTDIFGAMVEIAGQTTFGTVYDDEAPTELRAAAYLRAGDVTFTLGAGVGLAYAIGVPVVRAIGGASWDPRPRPDLDHDGVFDDLDGCPGEAEDVDDHADEDGCPDLDDDGDSIPDEADRCRLEAEDADDHEDEDGCPDLDDDQDGVRDGYDSCPNEAEDVDGDRDTDGCPDDDRDRDHIPDENDLCPNEAEDTDGLGDEDGCPETDFDRDGIPDDADECSDRAEDLDGHDDTDGCPEEATTAAPRGRAR